MMRAEGLCLQAGATTLVDRLDLRIEAGQCWCVIGRNGVGKSTLLRTFAGLQLPRSGEIFLDGKPLSAWPLAELARRRSYLPQARADAFSFTAMETVLVARHPYRDGYWESDGDRQAAAAALQVMDVWHLAQRDVRTLSGGERQRVAIAAVLAQDAPILLLDEPANALDLAHQASVMKALALLCRIEGKAVVFVSHDLNLAQAAADHALLLQGEGRWHAGPIEEMLQAPLLSTCLGHPVEVVRHGGRTVFLPAV